MVESYLLIIPLAFLCIITKTKGQCSIDEVTEERHCATYTQWKTHDKNNEISWAPDCTIDIHGYDLKTIRRVSDFQECANLCFQENQCTHYTFITSAGGRCVMKAYAREKGEEPRTSTGSYCGYINSRTDFFWIGK